MLAETPLRRQIGMIAHEAPRTPARRNDAQGAGATGFSTRPRRGRILVAMDDPKSGQRPDDRVLADLPGGQTRSGLFPSTRSSSGRVAIIDRVLHEHTWLHAEKASLWLGVGWDTVADLFGRAGLMAFDDALSGTA